MNIVGKSDLKKKQYWNHRIIKVVTGLQLKEVSYLFPMAIVCTNLYSESRKKTYFSRTTRVKNQKKTQVYYLNTDIKKSWRYRSVLSINISPLNWYASNVLHKRKRIPSNCRNLLTKRIPTLCCHFKKSNHDFTVHGRRKRGGGGNCIPPPPEFGRNGIKICFIERSSIPVCPHIFRPSFGPAVTMTNRFYFLFTDFFF